MIVLEGPDGGGKSTLAASLAVITGWRVLHAGGPPESAEEFRVRCSRLAELPFSALMDRHPALSELVYGELFPRSDPLPRLELAELARAALAPPTVLVYCRPLDATLAKHANSLSPKSHKPAEYVARVRARILDVASSYDREVEVLRGGGATVLTYDRDAEAAWQCAERVVKVARDVLWYHSEGSRP